MERSRQRSDPDPDRVEAGPALRNEPKVRHVDETEDPALQGQASRRRHREAARLDEPGPGRLPAVAAEAHGLARVGRDRPDDAEPDPDGRRGSHAHRDPVDGREPSGQIGQHGTAESRKGAQSRKHNQRPGSSHVVESTDPVHELRSVSQIDIMHSELDAGLDDPVGTRPVTLERSRGIDQDVGPQGSDLTGQVAVAIELRRFEDRPVGQPGAEPGGGVRGAARDDEGQAGRVGEAPRQVAAECAVAAEEQDGERPRVHPKNRSCSSGVGLRQTVRTPNHRSRLRATHS